MTGKQIYWNKEKEKKWESLCKGQDINFSEWVDKKLEEELSLELNEDYIQRQISNISAEIERLSGERNYWLKQLNKSKEIKEAQNNLKVEEESNKKDNFDYDWEVKKQAGFFLNYFGLKDEQAAEKFVKILMAEKPEDKTLALVKFADQEGLKFIKLFPWLKKYAEQGLKIEVKI